MNSGEKSVECQGCWLRSNTQRGIVLACCYCAGVLLAVFCWRNSPFRALRIPTPNQAVQPNELPAFGFGRRKQSGSGVPAFSVIGNKLRIDNAQHGFFNTPLHKTVVLEGLNIRFYCDSETAVARKQTVRDGMTSCCAGEGGCNAGIVGSVAAADVRPEGGTGALPVYRLWSPVSSSYFYTLDLLERDKFLSDPSDAWVYRGVAFYGYPGDSPSPDRSAVFRFRSARRRKHCYTSDISERDKLINSGLWIYEGVAWYGDQRVRRDEICGDNGIKMSQTSLGASEAAVPPGDRKMMAEAIEGLRQIEDQLMHPSIKMSVESPLLDIKRASSIIVRDLDYRVFQDDRLERGVKCKKAVMSYSTSGILLQGCVTITAQDGRELITNRVVWDIDRNRYDVPGSYILKCNGSAVRGRGIHCDDHLNVLRKAPSLWSADAFLPGRSTSPAIEHHYSGEL